MDRPLRGLTNWQVHTVVHWCGVIRAELLRRSLVKATTYRLLIMALDFATIYFLTGALGVSLGFVIASNIYTTLAYVGHERLWAHVQWGIRGSQ